MTTRNIPTALVRSLPAICWAFALAVASYQAWVWRDWMTIDGVGYLDMSDAFRDGVWKDVVNGVWSPLYSAVLATGLTALEFLPVSEFQAVHVINLAIFFTSWASYEYLLRQALAAQIKIHRKCGTEPLPEWIWYATARMLFVWASATMLAASLITPDLLAATVMFLSLGLLLRLIRKPASKSVEALFGAALGVDYLAKAILFPMAFVFLGTLFWACREGVNRWRQLGTVFAVFALVAGPYVTALSFARGRLTFSDVGKLNYAWHVNGLPTIHWQGGPEGHGTPIHPTRQIFDNPAIYEFDGPVGGTVPSWYDPSYWYEGVKLRFDLPEQLGVIASSAKAYWRIFAVSLGGFLLLVGVSLLLADDRTAILRLIAAQWTLLIPVAAALSAYGLVHVEGRYIAPFSVLFGLAALGAMAMPRRQKMRLVLISLGAGWFLVLAAKAGYSGFTSPPAVVGRLVRVADEVAAELAKQGVQRGDKVATLTASAAAWDRMLRVRVVAHAEWWLDGVEEKFWALDPGGRREIYGKLRDLGIRGIVLESKRRPVEDPGWQRLGNTQHYWRPLAEPDSGKPAEQLRGLE